MGPVAHGPQVLHDMRSVSKSVVGLLYGIALAEGRVPAPGTPLLDAFPAYADLARDERRRAIRVADALGMSMGLDWNEDLPYNDPRNSEIAMERSADRLRYVLERPIVAAPGTQWRYNGGTTVLLADLITRGSGLPLLRYAQDKLFTPLGITEAEWTHGPSGQPAAASGLRLRLPDLARIGQLLLQQGEWQGRAVVPQAWLTESLTPRLPGVGRAEVRLPVVHRAERRRLPGVDGHRPGRAAPGGGASAADGLRPHHGQLHPRRPAAANTGGAAADPRGGALTRARTSCLARGPSGCFSRACPPSTPRARWRARPPAWPAAPAWWPGCRSLLWGFGVSPDSGCSPQVCTLRPRWRSTASTLLCRRDSVPAR